MTRTAATMIGFVLAALSIALNVMRYPVVWEMAGPAGANETAQPSAASSPEKPESLSPARPPEPSPAVKTEGQLMPDTAEAKRRRTSRQITPIRRRTRRFFPLAWSGDRLCRS